MKPFFKETAYGKNKGGMNMNGLRTLRKLLIALAYILMATLVIPPIFNSYFNKIEPWILGMPFLIFWVVFINIVIAIVLLALWNIDKKLDGGEE
ncbi:hypothetical protein HMPREF1987_00751 [Peptostreptococcaceae bacterium oral taxon 113 str. W5053]|nr:hypothetical protein HMPREF1987_00751 [Peptostreptococcaceae bacterium oral taxon 113 str. W5053]